MDIYHDNTISLLLLIIVFVKVGERGRRRSWVSDTISYAPWGTFAYLLVDRGFTGKMKIRGAAGNAATKYSARDADTVRSLDNWRPGKGTGRLKKKLLDPPPTDRLWLDLPPCDAVQRKAQRDARIVKSNLKPSPVKKNRRDDTQRI